MKKYYLLALAAVALVAVSWANVSAAPASDSVRIAKLVDEMNGLTLASLESLPALEVQSYNLPKPGVDVMRVLLEETYTIDGIGEDTVELVGWIAVTHGKPSTSDWNTAVTDTQFVAMDLQGTSELFGAVQVTLDADRPAIGQVGAIEELPAAANIRLASEGGAGEEAIPERDMVICRAPVNVAVSMPELGLEMETQKPATWYSRVSTIPPVGHQASVTVEPIRMVSAGREVGTLVSGTVKFREVVRHVGLSDQGAVPSAQIAP